VDGRREMERGHARKGQTYICSQALSGGGGCVLLDVEVRGCTILLGGRSTFSNRIMRGFRNAGNGLELLLD